jgi:hypothetical protein
MRRPSRQCERGDGRVGGHMGRSRNVSEQWRYGRGYETYIVSGVSVGAEGECRVGSVAFS